MLLLLIVFLLTIVAADTVGAHNGTNATTHHHDKAKRDVHHLLQYRTNSTPSCVFTKDSHQKPRCVNNDTYCGDWTGRKWNSIGCKYREITSEQARKCMKGRTIACLGDSQIRDLCAGLGFFLAGQTVENASDAKYDKNGLKSLGTMGQKIGLQDRWKGTNVKENEDYNGVFFPSKSARDKEGWDWQVQVWELYSRSHLHAKGVDNKLNHAADILHNNMVNDSLGLRTIDLAFWSHGIHDFGWWNKPPYYLMYWEQMVGEWLRLYNTAPVPSVWVSMNNNCEHLISFSLMQNAGTQALMMEEVNKYVHKTMKHQNLPYFDAASVLRTPKICEVSGDGIHLKMFVDIVRSKILMNHLCDEDFNWRGGHDVFI